MLPPWWPTGAGSTAARPISGRLKSAVNCWSAMALLDLIRRPRRSQILTHQRAVEAHDIADDLGHGLVVLGRDLLLDLDSTMQRARERRVFDDRDMVLFRRLADLARD